jgi:hypothetical protein
VGGLGGQHLTALGAAHLGLEHSLLQVVQVLAAAEDVLPTVLMINTLINNMHVGAHYGTYDIIPGGEGEVLSANLG